MDAALGSDEENSLLMSKLTQH